MPELVMPIADRILEACRLTDIDRLTRSEPMVTDRRFGANLRRTLRNKFAKCFVGIEVWPALANDKGAIR
jgi:hypothetical protein